MAVTRPTLAAGLRHHGNRLLAAADRRRGGDQSCYVPEDAGYGDFGTPRRDARAMIQHARGIRDALRRRTPVADADFDRMFPEELRDRSELHWTPVAVALRAAELLAPSPGLRVLDVGAGVGKVCLVGALATEATWWGIEQDPVLVQAANHAAWTLDIGCRTRFVVGDGSLLAWDDLDAIYFYNPFGTLMLPPYTSPFVRHATVHATLLRIEQQLARTRIGTRVVTYHGFGGRLPAGYSLAEREPAGEDVLELWIREARAPG
jgi:predicted RNA methylase